MSNRVQRKRRSLPPSTAICAVAARIYVFSRPSRTLQGSAEMTSRRQFLKAGGGLAISFVLPVLVVPATSSERAADVGELGPTGSPTGAKSQDAKRVSAWLSLDKTGDVTLYAGKVELGTGVQTALAQLVAEELDVPIER